jgi:hypothetical protein
VDEVIQLEGALSPEARLRRRQAGTGLGIEIRSVWGQSGLRIRLGGKGLVAIDPLQTKRSARAGSIKAAQAANITTLLV